MYIFIHHYVLLKKEKQIKSNIMQVSELLNLISMQKV